MGRKECLFCNPNKIYNGATYMWVKLNMWVELLEVHRTAVYSVKSYGRSKRVSADGELYNYTACGKQSNSLL
jgi:hypothetical protein